MVKTVFISYEKTSPDIVDYEIHNKVMECRCAFRDCGWQGFTLTLGGWTRDLTQSEWSVIDEILAEYLDD